MDGHGATSSLKAFFEPESVAIIGASRKPGKAGYDIIDNMLRFGYKGEIYPINPSAATILGLAVYPDIRHTPRLAELAIIALPPSLVLSAFEECVAIGVRNIIIESGGFSEVDGSGARVEKKIAEIARQARVRVMGPNSIGTVNLSKNFITSFPHLNIYMPDRGYKPGSVAFIAQTGLFAATFLPLINTDLEMSKIVCLGNKCDVDECDMLEYLADDPQTKVIAMYLESIKDGRRFFKLNRRIVREKPVVILKSAITPLGARVSASHTGSLAGEDRVYDAAFKQLGIIRAENFGQLFDITKALTYCPLPKGNRVAILSNTGAGCVTAADACAKSGLEIAELSPKTRAEAKKVYPDWWQVKNPVDVLTALETSGFARAYTTLTRLALQDDGVDAAVIVLGAIDFLPGRDIPSLFKDIRNELPDKPLLVINILGDRVIYNRMCRGFKSLGIPTYDSVENGIRALAALYHYQQFRQSTGQP